MNKIREEFEKHYNTDYMTYDDRFDKYIINIGKGERVNDIKQLIDIMNILNYRWSTWCVSYKSRDEEIQKWRNRNDKQEAKIIDQDAEISELKIACNNYKDMYVEKMSENKKLKNYLEEIGYELADECPSSKNTIFKMIKEALEETDA